MVAIINLRIQVVFLGAKLNFYLLCLSFIRQLTFFLYVNKYPVYNSLILLVHRLNSGEMKFLYRKQGFTCFLFEKNELLPCPIFLSFDTQECCHPCSLYNTMDLCVVCICMYLCFVSFKTWCHFKSFICQYWCIINAYKSCFQVPLLR